MNVKSGIEAVAVGYTGLGLCPIGDLVSVRVLRSSRFLLVQNVFGSMHFIIHFTYTNCN
jgi:hypothetical protein